MKKYTLSSQLASIVSYAICILFFILGIFNNAGYFWASALFLISGSVFLGIWVFCTVLSLSFNFEFEEEEIF